MTIPQSAPGATNAASFTVTGLTNNTEYQFQVRAVNALGEGPPSDPSGATPTSGGVSLPNLSIADASVTEGDNSSVNTTFTVTLSPASAQTVTVNYATSTESGDTATAGTDYTAKSGTLTFSPGDTTKTFDVSVTADTLDEDNETFTVTLSGATNANISDATAIGTITDNDAEPGLSIADASVSEGDSGSVDATFTVTLSAVSGRQVTVDYATSTGSGDTATAGTDYTAASGTLTFAAGETSKTFTVSVTGDTTEENDETFTVTLSGATNAAISDSTAIGTINDDDGADPSLSIGNASVAEGNSGMTNMTFTVTLSAASSKNVTVKYATSDGTAKAGTDYTAVTSTTLTFSPGDTTKNFNVVVSGDATDEDNETFTVTLSDATNATISNATATGTITDDDAAPSLSIANASVAEGSGGSTNMTFTVSLSAASGKTVTVNYATSDGTAKAAGIDYNAKSTTLTFAAGDTTKTFNVTVTPDTLDEDDETFTVTLSGASNASISDSTATGTINDDDAAPSLSIGNASVTEGNSGSKDMTFTVSLSAASGKTVTVNYATSNGTATAGSDYTAVTSTTLTFSPGDTSKTFDVSVTGDTLDEDNETFTVSLSGASNATLADADKTATGTINDDDVPVISITGGSAVTEGSNAMFTVSASPKPHAGLTVNLTVSQSGSYVAAGNLGSKTVTVPTSGSVTYTVATQGDSVDEANGSVTVTLGTGTGYMRHATNRAASVTVNDDDAPAATPVISITGGSAVTEGTGATFTVSASPKPTSSLTVNLTITQSGSYVASGDLGSKTVTVPTSGSATYTVSTENDTAIESAGSVTATLNSGTGYDVHGTNNAATVSVNDNDQPVISITGGSAVTEGGNATFTVSANPAPAGNLTVNLTVSQSGSYVASGDLGSKTVTVPTSGSATYTVATENDSTAESAGSVTVAVATGTGYTAHGTDHSASVSVNDNDQPVISITGGSAVTEGGNATFTVSANPAPASNLTVNLTVSQDGSYVASGDLGSKTVTVTTSGSATYTVATQGDSTNEANGSVKVAVASGTGYTAHGTNNEASVTVNDNDQPVISITGGSAVTEGSNATFTVSASPKPHAGLTVNLTIAQSGSYVAAGNLGSKTVTVPVSGSVTHTVPTQGDSVNEANGSVTATIASGTGYTIASAPNNAASVTVKDDDVPVISITGGSAVTEGSNATFTVSASPKPHAGLTVNLTIAQSGSYVAAGNLGSKTVTIPVSGSVTHTVPTQGDSVNEATGSVTATIASGTGYTIANAPNNAASVTVNDDDVPVISITGGSAVTEGSNATFTVSASPTPAGNLTVKLTIAQSGSYVAAGNLGSKTVTIPVSGSVTHTVPTQGDGNDEANGSVTATIASGTGYTIASAPNNAASVTVNDNDVPVISITGGTAVTEGSNATFTLSISPAPHQALSVKIGRTQSGSFLTATGDLTVAVNAGDTSKSFTVPTQGDSVDEANGSVTATVKSGTGYNPHGTNNAATVTVNDDDVPVISITRGSTSSVTEGTSVTFTVSASPTPHADLTVKLTVTQSGSYVAAANLGSKTVKVPTSGSVTHTVATVGDGNDEANGSVTATIASGTGYTIASAPNNAATVTVNDDDVPEISITGGTAVTEGSNATFTVSANPTPHSDLPVNLTIAQSGSYVAAGNLGSKTVTVPSSGSVTHTVPTEGDNTDEPDGSVTATVKSGTGYTVHATNDAASVTVNDDEDAPTVTLELSASSIRENGGSATVTASLNHSSSAVTTITVSASAGSNTQASHFTQTGTSLSIAAGDTTSTGTVTIRAVDDTVSDSHQKSVNVTATAANSQGVNSAISSLNLEISDNETVPLLTIPDVSVIEGNVLIFTVTMDNTTSAAVSLTAQIDTADTTLVDPASADDYSLMNASATISVGNRTARFTVNSIDDADAEPNEQFRIVVDGTTGIKSFATKKALGTIENNDELEISTSAPGTSTTKVGNQVVTVNVGSNVPQTVKLMTPDQPTGDLTITLSEAASTVPRQSALFRVDDSNVVDIDVDGLAPGESIEVCFDVPPEIRRAAESAGKPLQVAHYAGGRWNPLENSEDSGTRVCANVTDFSPFTVLFEWSLSAREVVLKHALATVGSHMLSSAIDNIRTQFDEGSGGAEEQLRLAGRSVPLNGAIAQSMANGGAYASHRDSAFGGCWYGAECREGGLFGGHQEKRVLTLSDREMLGGSSFVLPLSETDAEGASGHRWSTWGRGDYISFSRSSGEPATYDGSLTSLYLGVDARTDEWLAGVALAQTESRMEFDQDSGLLETSMTAVHPYGQWKLTDDLETWAIVGVGRGDAERSQPDALTQKATLGMAMVAAGLRQTKTTVNDVQLATRAEASGIMLKTGATDEGNLGDLRASAWKVRAGVDAWKSLKRDNGAEIEPNISVMARFDGGDGETGAGIEVTGGIRYAKDRSVVEARLKKLVAYTASYYDEWGASVQVRLLPPKDGDGEGFSASLTYSLGEDTQTTDRLWDDSQRLSLIGTGFAEQGRMTMRFGYGIFVPKWGAMLTPFVELGEQNELKRVRFGSVLASKPAEFELSMYAEIKERVSMTPDNRVVIRLSMPF